ncbi:MAG TPA: serine hydrolase domain-containing protein [Frankiaceae bacterium]|nr:serine hydrolase domain-containing protein [Frankiaceae bacterium]
MADLTLVDPASVGLSAERLARIDTHFSRYVDDGRLPGYQVLVARRGQVAHLSSAGQADIEAGRAVAPDTLWRIYSMTKPVTSVAAMMLWEQGAFELMDPVSDYLPAFADTPVYAGGTAAKPQFVPQTEPMRMWHLLTHCSGLTYGFHRMHVVDEIYRNAGYEWGAPEGVDLAGAADAWAQLPLLFQPGSEWNYGVSTDVLGRVVEVLSGRPLDAFFAEHIFEPLGMTDSSFWVEPAQQDRLAALYAMAPGLPTKVRYDVMGDAVRNKPGWLSGGGGLVSTVGDYHRFTQMLLGGGELDGFRLLGPRTLAYMTTNHLPGGADLEQFGRRIFSEVRFDGVGFGLGFAVVHNPVAFKTLTSAGEFNWGGAASTAFYVDPVEELSVVFMTQLLPSSTYPLRSQLRQLVGQAIVE